MITFSLSILKLPHSYLNLRSPDRLSSEVVAFSNLIKATHVNCNLFLGIFIIKVLKILLPSPSHFNLSQCQPPISLLYSVATLGLSSINLTHLLQKRFPISIHTLIHFPSKLFLDLLLALIYTPFNFSLFFFIDFQTTFSPILRKLTPLLSIPISFITPSIYTLNSQGDTIHPCLTPLSILNSSLTPPFTLNYQHTCS